MNNKRHLLTVIFLLVAAAVRAQPPAVTAAAGTTTRDVQFYSEGVLCNATLYLPSGFAASSQSAAVVLAPGQGQTAAALSQYGARLAARGIVAMAIDYTGWGRSGGFLYLAEPVRWDDRLRFSQHTPTVRIRRKRISPEHQLLDVRNAITWLQGEPGIDPARVGVWGADLAGGHVITLAANDARVKAGVAQQPRLSGRGTPRAAMVYTPAQQAELVRLARTGQAPATPGAASAMNDAEARLALAEYRPFWHVDAVPKTTAILFVVGDSAGPADDDADVQAAAKLLEGPNAIVTVPSASGTFAGDAVDRAADAAADWFLKHL